jgi:hypothetical protein
MHPFPVFKIGGFEIPTRIHKPCPRPKQEEIRHHKNVYPIAVLTTEWKTLTV